VGDVTTVPRSVGDQQAGVETGENGFSTAVTTAKDASESLTEDQRNKANAWINSQLGVQVLPVTKTDNPTTISPAALNKQAAAEQKFLAQASAQERVQIATLIADTTNAQSIALKAGNQAGVVFTTVAMNVLNTIASSGGKNAGNTLEQAAIGLGKTTTEVLKMVGEGDVAAFGVVIGDLGGVLNGLQGGQPGKLLSASPQHCR
jgi:hypothetical protein